MRLVRATFALRDLQHPKGEVRRQRSGSLTAIGIKEFIAHLKSAPQQGRLKAMMYVSLLHGYPVYEPASDRELAQWRPCAQASLQFVKIARGQLWIFHDGQFLGCAQQLLGLEAWQASSNERGCCIAPLASPLECAWSLLEYEAKF